MMMNWIYLPDLVHPVFLLQLFSEQKVQLIDLALSLLDFSLKKLNFSLQLPDSPVLELSCHFLLFLQYFIFPL